MRMQWALVLFPLALFPGVTHAADWQPITTELLAKEKPGYGGLSGVVVDHTNGALYVCLSDRGVFRSTDQGKTWERFGKDACEHSNACFGYAVGDVAGPA